MTKNSFIQKNWVILTLVFIIIISFLLRIWQLGKIGEFIFDEVYFVKFSQNYLTGTSFFDIHPPFGKLIIASGFKIFGDTTFTWRITQAIFGTLLIPVAYLAGKEIHSKITGLLAATIIALDGLILVYSRTGLIDIFLIFFILLAFTSFLKYANTRKVLFLILAGIFLGLAASIKYIGALTILIFLVIMIVKKIPFHKNFIKFLAALIFLPLIIYLSFFIQNFGLHRDFFAKVLEWHNQSFNYNLTLKDTHPYASKWWTWFLVLRPIWLYYKDSNGQIVGVLAMGNPLAWWSSLVVVPLLIWGCYKKYASNMIILGAFLIFLLFWAPFSRVLFYYHAMPSFIFLSLGTAFWLERLLKIPNGKYYLAIYLCLLVAFFVFFLPIWVGIPLTSAQFYHRIWLKGWI